MYLKLTNLACNCKNVCNYGMSIIAIQNPLLQASS